MGLDVVAFEKVTLLDSEPEADDGAIHAFVLDGFEASLGGLKAGGWYKPSGERYHFGAGSYSGYNEWREELCRRALGVEASEVWAHPDKFAYDPQVILTEKPWQAAPFVELINFADNEGTIGPVACAKLLLDFRQLADRVRDEGPDSTLIDVGDLVIGAESSFNSLYDAFSNAFALTAGRGLVMFT